MRSLSQRVGAFICKQGLLFPGDRLGLAVSGGADSVALLRLMLELRSELGIVVSVVHFNHRLRGVESDADEKFVGDLAREFGSEFFCGGGDVGAHALAGQMSVEAAARALRYEFFLETSRTNRLSKIATAHTLDDQAETVLLKLARGAGTRGLAGIYPKLGLGGVSIIRPLLRVRRLEVESYLKNIVQPWREDASNRDIRHSRNVVRHGILPRLERNLNPAIREALAETADIARTEEEYWTEKVDDLLPSVLKSPSVKSHESEKSRRLSINKLSSRAEKDYPLADDLAQSRDLLPDHSELHLDCGLLSTQPLAMQRRIIRAYAESLGFKLEFKHVEKVLGLLASKKSVALPGGWTAHQTPHGISFKKASARPVSDYEYVLPVPGKIEVPEAGAYFQALLTRPSAGSAYNFDEAFDPALIAGELCVRNWRAGDRFLPGHCKSAKKVKELLVERKNTGAERKRVPVIVSGSEVIWLAGFAISEKFKQHNANAEAVIIRTRAQL